MRSTPTIIAVALAAGLAHASPFLTATTGAPAATDPIAPNGSNPAGGDGFPPHMVIDLAGIEFWDGAGSPNNTVLNIDSGYGFDFQVTEVAWEITIQTQGASWLSEATIGFLDSPVGLQLTPGSDANPGTATYSSGGFVDLAAIDPTFPFWIGADSTLSLEFFESFDDVANAVDATIISGTLWINVPSPAPLALLGVGLLGVARRRR